jgi:AcrR family transcriptional regulator
LRVTVAQENEPLRGKAATQARILGAAGALFVERGYEQTTIARIAKRANVSRATVFWHFGDKEGLFRESFAMLLVPFREALSRDLSHLQPQKQLEQHVASYLDFVHRRRDVLRAIVRWAIESPELRGEIVDTLMGLHAHFTGLLRDLFEETLPAGRDAGGVASGMTAMLHGTLLLGLFEGLGPSPDALRSSAASILALIHEK